MPQTCESPPNFGQRGGQTQKEPVMKSIAAAPDAAPDLPQSPQRVPRRGLDAWALAYLDGKHDKPTHYSALCAVAAHALARGWTRAELWEPCEPLARLSSVEDDKRPANSRRVSRKITKAWDYAQRTRKTQADPFTLRTALNAAREHLERSTFTGRQNSLALVMEAALVQAQTQKTLAPSLAVRSLELATGLGKSTVARALQRLVALGYLSLLAQSDGEKASTYRVRHTEPMVTQSGTHKVFPCGTKGLSHLGTATELAAQDAFRALGRSAARVAAALDALEAQTPAELAQRLGIAAKTARTALRELEAVGLAYRQRQGRGFAWTVRPELATEEALQRIALDYGTHGTRERREATTAAQRERWGQWQETRRKALQRKRRNFAQAWKLTVVAA